MTKPMRTCPDCGAWLDSGERCNCRDEAANDTAQEAGAKQGRQRLETLTGPYSPPAREPAL